MRRPVSAEELVDALAPRSRIPLPPLVRGTRRAPRALRGVLPPGVTRSGAREALRALLERKGQLRTSEALLVVVCWLEQAGLECVPAPSVRAVYPDTGPALGTMPHYLQHLVSVGLLERVATAVYRATPLGRAVADALPDRAAVRALRAMRLTPPSPRRLPRGGLDDAPESAS